MNRLTKFLILSSLLLAACEEKGVDDHSRHRRTAHIQHWHDEEAHTLVDPAKQQKVAEFESFVATGALLQGATIRHFYLVLRALLDGVFDPNSALSPADIQRIGPTNCTQDDLIGVRRFERVITMAPELLSMRDIRGLDLRDWLINLKRDDLLNALR